MLPVSNQLQPITISFFDRKVHRLAAVLAALVMAAGISMVGLSLGGTISTQFLYVGITSIASDVVVFGVILAVHFLKVKKENAENSIPIFAARKPKHYARSTALILDMKRSESLKAPPREPNEKSSQQTSVFHEEGAMKDLLPQIFSYLSAESLWLASFTCRLFNLKAAPLMQKFIRRGDIPPPVRRTQTFASFNLNRDESPDGPNGNSSRYGASDGNRLAILNYRGKGVLFEVNKVTRLLELKNRFDLNNVLKSDHDYRIHRLVKHLVYFEHKRSLYTYNLENNSLENPRGISLATTQLEVRFISEDSIKLHEERRMTGCASGPELTVLYDLRGKDLGPGGLLINGKHQMVFQLNSIKYNLRDALQYKDKIIVFDENNLKIISLNNNRIVLDSIKCTPDTRLLPNGLLLIQYMNSESRCFYLIFNLETENWLPYEYLGHFGHFKLGDLQVEFVNDGISIWDSPEASPL